MTYRPACKFRGPGVLVPGTLLGAHQSNTWNLLMKKFLILSSLMAAAIGPAIAGGISTHGETSAMSAGPSVSQPVATSISVASSTSHSSDSAMSQSSWQSNACPPSNVKTGRGQCELPSALYGVNRPVYLDYQVGKTFWGKRKVDGVIRSGARIPVISFQSHALHISCTKHECEESGTAVAPMPAIDGYRDVDFTAHCHKWPTGPALAHCTISMSERDAPLQ